MLNKAEIVSSLLKRYRFILLFAILVPIVFSCDVVESEKLECGYNIKTRDDCLALNCCYDESSANTTPKCYFQRKDAAGAPIQHSNGLCLYPKNATTTDNTSLIWSANCHSKNALFLVSHNSATYHLASGKCILPRNGELPDPGIGGELVLGSKQCHRNLVKFKVEENGNLVYYYLEYNLEVCIGEGLSSFEPKEGDMVTLSKRACFNDPTCQHLTYVYEKRTGEGNSDSITCPGSSSILVTWAFYGQLGKIILSNPRPEEKPCSKTTTTSIMRKKCNGQSTCPYQAKDEIFFDSDPCSSVSKYLIIRYTCHWNVKSVLVEESKQQETSYKKFAIRLPRPKDDEKYIQIIVQKLVNDQPPKRAPHSYSRSDLKAYDQHSPSSTPYVAAELSRHDVIRNPKFTVGDGRRYSKSSIRKRRDVGYLNAELQPGSYYTVFQRTFQDDDFYYNSDWMDVVRTKFLANQKLEDNSSTRIIDYSGRNALSSTQSIGFIVVIAVQFIINIILGLLVLRLFRSVRSRAARTNTMEKQEDKSEIHADTALEIRNTLHEYEIPIEARPYQELDLSSLDDEHVYQSLKMRRKVPDIPIQHDVS